MIKHNPYEYKSLIIAASSSITINTYNKCIAIVSIAGTSTANPLKIAFGENQEQLIQAKTSITMPADDILDNVTLYNNTTDALTVDIILSQGQVILW